ncbi:MAG: DegV family protein [Chloroflexi bacterium]|nr:DegV family protein [Chloroflexota bacterium]
MAKAALLIDSTTTIPQDLIKEYGVTVIPVPIHAAGKEYRDGVDLTPEKFCDLLETSKDRPSTAVPGLGEFVAFYQQLLQTHKHVIYPVPSPKLTGIFNAAIQAASQVENAQVVAVDPPEGWEGEWRAVHSDDPLLKERLAEINKWTDPVIAVVNTNYVSGAAGLVGMQGFDAIHQGLDLDEALYRMVIAKPRAGIYFILTTLDYVVDRVGHLRAFLGTLLKIKPVLTLRNGMVEDEIKVRGEGKAKKALVELLKQRVGDREVDLFVLHSLAQAEAEELLAQAKNELCVRNAWLGGIGCAITRYTGRGGLGIAFIVR